MIKGHLDYGKKIPHQFARSSLHLSGTVTQFIRTTIMAQSSPRELFSAFGPSVEQPKQMGTAAQAKLFDDATTDKHDVPSNRSVLRTRWFDGGGRQRCD
jgi:hypothetical protein